MSKWIAAGLGIAAGLVGTGLALRASSSSSSKTTGGAPGRTWGGNGPPLSCSAWRALIPTPQWAADRTKDLLAQALRTGDHHEGDNLEELAPDGRRMQYRFRQHPPSASNPEWHLGCEAWVCVDDTPDTPRPSGALYRAEGVDVSDAQGLIDWPRVRSAGIAFAFCKATEGLPGRYKQAESFGRNWAGSKSAGVRRGAYHYFRPDLDAEAQAEHFASTVKGQGLDFEDLAPVLDVEEAGNLPRELYGPSVLAFLERVRDEFGREPMVYTSPDPWSKFVRPEDAAVIATRAHLWLAQWDTSQPSTAEGWPAVPGPLFWQYRGGASAAVVDGIPELVDLDRFRGTEAELDAYAGAVA